jgi:hypothetical protein
MKYSYLYIVESETKGSCQARQNLRSGLRKLTPCPGSKKRTPHRGQTERASSERKINKFIYIILLSTIQRKGDIDYGNESKGSREVAEVCD